MNDVCVVTTIHPPFDGRIYHKELQAYLAAGFRVALVCPWERPGEVADGLTWVTLPKGASRITRLFHAARAFLVARRVPARCYHFHDLDFVPWAVLLKIVTGRPVIYDCHENYPEEILYNKPYLAPWIRKPLAALVRLGESGAVRVLGLAIVVVPNLVERFSRLGARVALVRNFPAWEPDPALPHDRAVICTGSLSVANGALMLIEIARALKARGSAVVMRVTRRFQNADIERAFAQAIAHEGLAIEIVPAVPATQMGSVLSKGCIGLSVEQDVPNMRMGYHTKLFEYMAFGLPVVSSDIAGNRALIEGAGAGLLVRPDDAAAYCDAIERLLGDPALFDEHRRKGFEAIRSTYTWRVEQSTMIDFVRAAIGGVA